jgi:NAD+ diphosphatase
VSGPPLSEATYDRAAHRRADQAWLADAWQRAQVVLISPKSATPVVDGRAAFRPAGESPDGSRRFLGLVSDVPYFAVTAEPDGDNWQTLREFGARADELEAGLVVSAVALEQWHQRHTHCPLCGAATEETQAGWTRNCVADGSQHFPRTDPAVIMLVHDGADRALLGRGHQWGEGRFSTLAGFVEPGESLEAAVAREVYEEVGVRVRDIRYLASQPWPFPSSLMLGFTARAMGTDLTLQAEEIEAARWFTRDQLVAAIGDGSVVVSGRISISRRIIEHWFGGPLDAPEVPLR